MTDTNYDILTKTTIFHGFKDTEIAEILNLIKYSVKEYDKEEYIFHIGDNVSALGVLLCGNVQIENNDILGNRTILGMVNQSEAFAEAYACISNEPIRVDVVAQTPVTVLFIEVSSIFSMNDSSGYQMKLIHNLLQTTAKKNISLSMRNFHTSPRTIRARLCSYFAEQTNIQHSKKIHIPLNRQQLADYLSVDRFALSKELTKMKQEGLIEGTKSEFEIRI